MRRLKKITDHNLDKQILQWVVSTVDPHAIIHSINKLKGSTSSILHHISLQSNDRVKDFVVRQFDNKEWLEEEPDLAYHESESLRVAEKIAVKTPQIIAYDEKGQVCGVPLVLMTLLEGSVDLKPRDMSNWLEGLAKALVNIHAIEAGNFQWKYFTYNHISSLEVPSWSKTPQSWEKAIEIVKGPKPKYKECFIHRDYHPTNVLWEDGVVSGIVDWVNACIGPAGIDVGHCRLNLALLYDVETADAFLTAYIKNAGDRFTYDPYWDLLSCIDILFGPPTVYPGWEAFGITGLTDQMMEERLDDYVKSLINK